MGVCCSDSARLYDYEPNIVEYEIGKFFRLFVLARCLTFNTFLLLSSQKAAFKRTRGCRIPCRGQRAASSPVLWKDGYLPLVGHRWCALLRQLLRADAGPEVPQRPPNALLGLRRAIGARLARDRSWIYARSTQSCHLHGLTHELLLA